MIKKAEVEKIAYTISEESQEWHMDLTASVIGFWKLTFKFPIPVSILIKAVPEIFNDLHQRGLPAETIMLKTNNYEFSVPYNTENDIKKYQEILLNNICCLPHNSNE